MNRQVKISVLLAALALMLTVAPALAAPPLGVHIVVPASITSDPDPFTATGPAVAAGVVCPDGNVTDLSYSTIDLPGGRFRILRVLKQFDCADASGTFDVRLVVLLSSTSPYTLGIWSVAGGTGDYGSLRGNGGLVGIPIVPGDSVLDIYNGIMH